MAGIGGGPPSSGLMSNSDVDSVAMVQLGRFARWVASSPSVHDFSCGRQSMRSAGTASRMLLDPATI